jgi:hypothetical protein
VDAQERSESARAEVPAGAADEIAALKADIEMLKGRSPSASVAMSDVGFHFSNLWFRRTGGQLAAHHLLPQRGAQPRAMARAHRADPERA